MSGTALMDMADSRDTAALSDRERELGAILKAYSDVTDRLKVAHERLNEEVSRLREELRRKNEELRRRDRLAALGEMAAGLAHEIRNPLGGIALYSSMLEREVAELPKAHQAASRISSGVRTLDRLVSDILDFAQEDHLEKQAVTLGAILADVEDGLCPWADQLKAAIRIDDASRNISLMCDAGKMKQVLLNLMLNGLQAAGSGGWVRLSARHCAGDDTQPDGVEIEILDSGKGIPAESLDRIFNPFFTTKSTGTGLGLAIVHRIIEAHGGTIRAMNSAEGGAKFVVWLTE
ncbi:MAG: sensor histidine kinase [Planctomycetes bacterium]|nr:sensor histidine kinase [Planctomycetota bacterium]